MEKHAFREWDTDTQWRFANRRFAALIACMIGLATVPDARAQSAPTAGDVPSAATAASRQREKALNPQPLPPIDKPGVRANALNPQPLPPIDKPGATAKTLNPQPLPPIDSTQAKALNPQPLPPIDKPGARAKALNPQPLPPIDKPGTSVKALNPQPLPPVDSRIVKSKPGNQ